MIVRIEIPGRIVPKGNSRNFSRAGNAYGRAVERSRAYNEVCGLHARLAMQGEPPIEGACRADIQIVLQTPASWPRKRKERHNWCTAKPDLDNACKALLDGLKGVVFADDRQVVEVAIRKLYGAADRVVVTVEALEQPAQQEAA